MAHITYLSRKGCVAVTCAVVALPGCGAGDAKRRDGTRPNHAPAKADDPLTISSLRGEVTFSKRADIWVAGIDGSHARRVTHRRGPEDDSSWSPDGSRLAYRDSRSGYNRDDAIYVVNRDGTHRRRLTPRHSNAWGPAWSPDGRLIAFNLSLQLHVMRPDGSGRRPLLDMESEYPAWAPDSRRLAFMSLRPGSRGSDPDYDIFTLDLATRRVRQLTDWPGEEGWPAWSPDGRSILFTTTHGAGARLPGGQPATTIYRMDRDGSAKRRLVHGMYASFPTWSPDGRTVLFMGSRSTKLRERLWVIRPDGSGLRALPILGTLADWRTSRRRP